MTNPADICRECELASRNRELERRLSEMAIEVVALTEENNMEDRANYWIQVDPATVEQFIGLTDKYSKKIIFYERSMLL